MTRAEHREIVQTLFCSCCMMEFLAAACILLALEYGAPQIVGIVTIPLLLVLSAISGSMLRLLWKHAPTPVDRVSLETER